MNARSSEEEIIVTWLGTAGFCLRAGDYHLFFDPYVSRHSLWRLLFYPAAPDEQAVERHIAHADAILVGHSHFDHMMDVAHIVQKTRAVVYGSRTTCDILRHSGVGEDPLREVKGGDTFTAGPFSGTVVPGLHGKVMGILPFSGTHRRPWGLPLFFHHFREGGTLSYHLAVDGFRLYLHSGGDVLEEELKGLRADLLITNIAARHKTYVWRVIRALKPRIVIPCHFDNFFRPFHKKMKSLPLVRYGRFLDEVREADPAVEVVRLEFFQRYVVHLESRLR